MCGYTYYDIKKAQSPLVLNLPIFYVKSDTETNSEEDTPTLFSISQSACWQNIDGDKARTPRSEKAEPSVKICFEYLKGHVNKFSGDKNVKDDIYRLLKYSGDTSHLVLTLALRDMFDKYTGISPDRFKVTGMAQEHILSARYYMLSIKAQKSQPLLVIWMPRSVLKPEEKSDFKEGNIDTTVLSLAKKNGAGQIIEQNVVMIEGYVKTLENLTVDTFIKSDVKLLAIKDRLLN